MRAYSTDLRERVIQLREKGETQGAIATLQSKAAPNKLSVDTILNALSSTGKIIIDTRNNACLAKKRIQLDAALNALAAPTSTLWTHTFDFGQTGDTQNWFGLEGTAFVSANHDWESIPYAGYWRNHIGRNFSLTSGSSITSVQVCGNMGNDNGASAYIKLGDQYAVNTTWLSLSPGAYCVNGTSVNVATPANYTADVVLDTHPGILLTITQVIISGIGTDPFGNQGMPSRSVAPAVPNIIVQSTVAPTQVPTHPPTKAPPPGDGGGLD